MQFPQDQLLGQLVIVGLAARCLAESGADDWIKRASGILAGSIEFREGYGQVRGDKNANRIKLSQPLWWSYVIACLAIPERLKLAPRLPTSFEAMVNWMELDWPRALAKYAAVYGMPAAKLLFAQLCKLGYEKLTEQDHAIINFAREALELIPKRTTTGRFNADPANVEKALQEEDTCHLDDWFDGAPETEVNEDVIGLGAYGKTLTVLFTDEPLEDEDENDDED